MMIDTMISNHPSILLTMFTRNTSKMEKLRLVETALFSPLPSSNFTKFCIGFTEKHRYQKQQSLNIIPVNAFVPASSH